MPARRLPADANLENLKNQAKALQRLVRAGRDEGLVLVAELHPRLGTLTVGAPELARFSRADALLVIARMYGFASWPALRRHFDVLTRYSRWPHRPPAELDDLADEFLRLACLTYGTDDLTRHEQARVLLADHPEVATASIHTMAAVGDAATAAALLTTDPRQARREGGPHRWEPLLYLAYSRVNSTEHGHSPVTMARLLLDHGADPNAGYLWETLPSPFTALTGVFGEGEDAVNQPRHPHCAALARLLLDAGADPNDSQTLYNRQFNPDNTHLELLLGYGLGTGTGGPWHERLGSAHQTPTEMVQDQLLWAAMHDMPDRARLLLDHGVVDPNGRGTHPGYGGRTAHEAATLAGNTDIAHMLVAAGAEAAVLDPTQVFTAACMRADRDLLDDLAAADPTLAARAITADPGLMIRAAEHGRLDAVRLMAALGFDVNIRQRTTALHEAAYRGDLDMVRLLIELGADPSIEDTEYHSPPAGWAEHNHQPHVAAYLSSLGARRRS
jgi:Ankyrin repeats (many copies)